MDDPGSVDSGGGGPDAAIQRRLDLAIDAARAAGDVTRALFGRAGLGVQSKGDGSPVTEGDRRAETEIRRLIGSAFPHDAIRGEEHADTAGDSGLSWLIDPIDGTISFVRGVPLYGTLIALERDGSLVAGVISMPELDEMVFASVGGGAWHARGDRSPEPARVSTIDCLDRARFTTTSVDYFDSSGCRDLFLRLCDGFGSMRGWSDCYGYMLLATGRVDAVVEPNVHPWDIAAGHVIVREAGGRATDFSGGSSVRTGTSLATNGRIHEQALGVIRAGWR